MPVMAWSECLRPGHIAAAADDQDERRYRFPDRRMLMPGGNRGDDGVQLQEGVQLHDGGRP
jgi:hypothetical protein